MPMWGGGGLVAAQVVRLNWEYWSGWAQGLEAKTLICLNRDPVDEHLKGRGMGVCEDPKQFNEHADAQRSPHASPCSSEPEQNVGRWPDDANSPNTKHEKSATESNSFGFPVPGHARKTAPMKKPTTVRHYCPVKRWVMNG